MATAASKRGSGSNSRSRRATADRRQRRSARSKSLIPCRKARSPRRDRAFWRELKGRGVAWTEERGTSDEGRRRLKAPRRRAGDTAWASCRRRADQRGRLVLTCGGRRTAGRLSRSGLHSHPESAKQVVGTLGVRVITQWHDRGDEADPAAGRDCPRVRPSVAGVGSVGTQGTKFREDWSLWQRR